MSMVCAAEVSLGLAACKPTRFSRACVRTGLHPWDISTKSQPTGSKKALPIESVRKPVLVLPVKEETN